MRVVYGIAAKVGPGEEELACGFYSANIPRGQLLYLGFNFVE
jgi:hypothetical protein